MRRFQFLLILDLWGISFHAVVVFGLGKNLLPKSSSRTLCLMAKSRKAVCRLSPLYL